MAPILMRLICIYFHIFIGYLDFSSRLTYRDRFWWCNGYHEPLVLQQVGLVSVIADQILERIELSTADVKVTTN